jgi:hypothetical protein
MRRDWFHTKWGRHGHAPGAPAFVHLIRGRWVVRCPFCPRLVAFMKQERFVCPLCGNAAAGGRYAEVRAPSIEFAQALQPLMLLRPVENRSWLHGETLNQIRAENIEHGLEA